MAIIKSKLSDGTELMIETDDITVEELSPEEDEFRGMPRTVGEDESRDMPRSVEKIIDSGKNLIQEAVIRIQVCASEIAAGINDIKEKMRPDEVEASLAFKLTAEAGAIITKLGGEAQLQVKLVWKDQKKNK